MLNRIKINMAGWLCGAICLWMVNVAAAQKIDTVARGHFMAEKKSKMFIMLDAQTDTAQLQFVATLRVVSQSKKASPGDFFFAIRKAGMDMGANCFRLKAYSRDSTTTVLALDACYTDEPLLKACKDRREKNTVYVFGSDRPGDEKSWLKVNGEKVEFPAGTYLKMTLKDGDDLKLSRGGITGSSATLRYQEDKPAMFLSVSGAGVGAAPDLTVGLSFNTGRINPISPEVGLLLAQVLKPYDTTPH